MTRKRHVNLRVEPSLHEAAQQVADRFGLSTSEAHRLLLQLGVDQVQNVMQTPEPSPALIKRYLPLARSRVGGCRSEAKVAQMADRMARVHLTRLAAEATSPPKSGDELVRALAAQTGMDEAEIVAALAEHMSDLAGLVKPDDDMPDGAPADQAVAGRRMARGTKAYPAKPGETRAAYCARVIKESRAKRQGRK